MKLYLDIDGVILEPWWLTTHSDGTIDPIVRHLAPYCSNSVLDLVRRIRPWS